MICTSVGCVGYSYDNALAETINGLYKTEVIHRQGPWKDVVSVEFATLQWVDWFNNRRLLGSIVYVPPAEYKLAYYRQKRDSGHGGVSQTKQSPDEPGRFTQIQGSAG